MEKISFSKLLLKSVFCCMASDGNIDDREINIIKSMCEKSPLFANLNFQEEINQLIYEINTNGKTFIQDYFNLLKQSQLSEEEELMLINFAVETIKADEQIEYSEIKFFKNIRHRLNLSDDKILERFPDIEFYLEQDIISEGFLDKITKQYFETIELPQFDLLKSLGSENNMNKKNS